MDPGSLAVLRELLRTAQAIGLVGPGPVDAHVAHALHWVDRLPEVDAFLDLGSGAGLPGLAVVLAREDTRATLLDARQRSATWLDAAVERLDVGRRVQVLCARAEVAARDPALREQFPLVVARGFGSPAATAECAAGFLRIGGVLSVSEPPEERGDRWPCDRLGELGLGPAVLESSGPFRFVVIPKVGPIAARWPRRDGRPRRRPLW